MLKEFKEFAVKGNMIDLAVGVMIGTAFNAIVSSLVKDIFMPVIGIIMGGKDFSGLSIVVGNATIQYGLFVQNVFNFLITAFCLFLLVKTINSLKRKKEEPKEEVVEIAEDIVLLTEIKELLGAIKEK
ncbi:MAG: large-conductance mechanosensitive channel protein MscL [Ruminococcaceae bacterium]|nr:large-conductance mechanosensitive channel protein MscL [Oscillospiraceae bacterium]